MHLTITREHLITSLSRVSVAVAARNTIPVLSYARVEASDTGLRITTTDMEQTVTEAVEANVEVGGVTLLPVAQALDIAKRLPKGSEVVIKASNIAVTIRSGRYHTTIAVPDVDDFPEQTDRDYTCSFTVPANELKAAIDNVLFAASSEETRYFLCGIHIHTDDDRLKFVATDGHRLAVARIMRPDMAGDMPDGVILPKKAAADVVKMLDGDTPITVSLSDARARFDFGSFQLDTKLVDGQYPDYKRVIPSDHPLTMIAPASVLESTVQRVAAVSKEKSKPVKFEAKDNVLNLSCSFEGNTAQDVVDVNWPEDELTIGFQARYTSDVLTRIRGNVICRFRDGTCPAVLTDDGNPDVMFVIMPIRC